MFRIIHSDFSRGINDATHPELINHNELVEAQNVEYIGRDTLSRRRTINDFDEKYTNIIYSLGILLDFYIWYPANKIDSMTGEFIIISYIQTLSSEKKLYLVYLGQDQNVPLSFDCYIEGVTYATDDLGIIIGANRFGIVDGVNKYHTVFIDADGEIFKSISGIKAPIYMIERSTDEPYGSYIESDTTSLNIGMGIERGVMIQDRYTVETLNGDESNPSPSSIMEELQYQYPNQEKLGFNWYWRTSSGTGMKIPKVGKDVSKDIELINRYRRVVKYTEGLGIDNYKLVERKKIINPSTDYVYSYIDVFPEGTQDIEFGNNIAPVASEGTFIGGIAMLGNIKRDKIILPFPFRYYKEIILHNINNVDYFDGLLKISITNDDLRMEDGTIPVPIEKFPKEKQVAGKLGFGAFRLFENDLITPVKCVYKISSDKMIILCRPSLIDNNSYVSLFLVYNDVNDIEYTGIPSNEEKWNTLKYGQWMYYTEDLTKFYRTPRVTNSSNLVCCSFDRVKFDNEYDIYYVENRYNADEDYEGQVGLYPRLGGTFEKNFTVYLLDSTFDNPIISFPYYLQADDSYPNREGAEIKVNGLNGELPIVSYFWYSFLVDDIPTPPPPPPEEEESSYRFVIVSYRNTGTRLYIKKIRNYPYLKIVLGDHNGMEVMSWDFLPTSPAVTIFVHLSTSFSEREVHVYVEYAGYEDTGIIVNETVSMPSKINFDSTRIFYLGYDNYQFDTIKNSKWSMFIVKQGEHIKSKSRIRYEASLMPDYFIQLGCTPDSETNHNIDLSIPVKTNTLEINEDRVVWSKPGGYNFPASYKWDLKEKILFLTSAPSRLKEHHQNTALAFTNNFVMLMPLTEDQGTWALNPNSLIEESLNLGIHAPKSYARFGDLMFWKSEHEIVRWDNEGFNSISVNRIDIDSYTGYLGFIVPKRKQYWLHRNDTKVTYVYHYDTDRFTKFTGLDIISASSIIEGTDIDNKTVLLSATNVLSEYPNEKVFYQDCHVVTAHFDLNYNEISRISTRQDGTLDYELSVENSYNTPITKTVTGSIVTSSVRKSLQRGLNGEVYYLKLSDFDRLNLVELIMENKYREGL